MKRFISGLVTVVFSLLLCNNAFINQSLGCEKKPKQLKLEVEGASKAKKNLYIIQVPEKEKTEITIKGSGSAPCPEKSEDCKCGNEKKEQPLKGGLRYTFKTPTGTSPASEKDTITFPVKSTTPPGEYKFTLLKVEQRYEKCPEGSKGGVKEPKVNDEASEEITIVVCKIETETLATRPGHRDRKQLGVGEQVSLIFHPSKDVKWSASGGATVSEPLGEISVLSVDHKAGTVNVKAQYEGVDLKVTFTKILPTGVTGRKGGESYGGKKGTVGLVTIVKFQPTTVSFGNLEVKELPKNASNVTDYFANKKVFTPGPLRPGLISLRHYPRETFEQLSEDNEIGDLAALDFAPAPWSSGHFEWEIPIRARIYSETKEFSVLTIYQYFDMLDKKGNCTVSKAGVHQP